MKHRFKELKVWQKAMEAAQLTYEQCAAFPGEEKFGLTAQMRRAAVSIPSNIAEGAGRNSKLEFKQFLAVATGSAYELETQFMLAETFGYVSAEKVQDICQRLDELQRMLHGLQQSLGN